MSYFYCCPKCGHVLQDNNLFCSYCLEEIAEPIRSKYETNYYTQIAQERFPYSEEGLYGNRGKFRWGEVLLEEISKNPLFDQEKCMNRIRKRERTVSNLDHLFNSNINKNNQPKCPTCSSTNIQKISTASKVVGASLFGLFSKNARSQFKCNNCGYKW